MAAAVAVASPRVEEMAPLPRHAASSPMDAMAERDSLAASLLVLLSLEPKLEAVRRSAMALEVVVVVVLVVLVAV